MSTIKLIVKVCASTISRAPERSPGSSADRIGRRQGICRAGPGSHATFRQQFSARLLPQVFHGVHLLVEMFGSPANSSMLHLSQSLLPMTLVVHVSSRASNSPTAIQRFQTTHDSSQILGDRQVTARQFGQRTHSGLTVVDRLEIVAT